MKEGAQEKLRAAWQEFAEWTSENVPGAIPGQARLLEDLDDPRVFYSFGPWESLEAIAAWRANPGFQERIGRIREVLDSVETHTLRTVVAR